MWAKMIGNNGYGGSSIGSVIAIENKSQFVGGAFKQSGKFDPLDTSKTLTATGDGLNTFFAKYSDIPLGIIEHTNNIDFSVYPNPSRGQITIEVKSFNQLTTESAELILVNILGKEMYRETIPVIHGSYQRQLDVSNYGSGIYFFVLLHSNTQEYIIGKLIVE